MAGLEQPRRQHQPVGRRIRDCGPLARRAGAVLSPTRPALRDAGPNQQTRPAFVKQRARVPRCRHARLGRRAVVCVGVECAPASFGNRASARERSQNRPILRRSPAAPSRPPPRRSEPVTTINVSQAGSSDSSATLPCRGRPDRLRARLNDRAEPHAAARRAPGRGLRARVHRGGERRGRRAARARPRP
jgi:hypothetical protein